MPTRQGPTISSEFAALLLDWLDASESATDALRQTVSRRTARGRLKLKTWQRLLARALASQPGSAVGLEIGSGVGVRHVGTLGYLVVNCETIADALETYLHCEHQFYGVNFANLDRAPDRWMVSWRLQSTDALGLVVDVAFAALFMFMRQRFGSACRLHTATFPGESPDDTTAYEELFGCPVSFGSTAPGLTFALDYDQQPAPLIGTGDFAILREEQDSAFENVVPVSDHFLRRLRHISLKLLPDGQLSLARIAAEMDVTPRTFQRRLADHHLKYQDLLDGLREQLAKRYLSRGELSLTQLAQLLGFSEQSAFQRAFKQWTGMTPGHYRQIALH